jgi:ribonuclease D
MEQAGNVPIDLVTHPEMFLRKIRDYGSVPELFIDTETVDSRTPAPRVSLLQVWAGREVTVFDVLAPGMGNVLAKHFVPRVMANTRIRKWAHNASYERRFLGGARVQNLECTLRLARGIAFHRLPTETLSLASLVKTLFGVTLDKTLQSTDWAVRPLSQEHLRYAAADTIWCARLRRALEGIERPPRPEDDDLETIDAAFPDAKRRELSADAELKVLRESVRSLMT